ncbi:MAG: hypothetical protein ABIR02_03515 [Novosphingobium sp.]
MTIIMNIAEEYPPASEEMSAINTAKFTARWGGTTSGRSHVAAAAIIMAS